MRLCTPAKWYIILGNLVDVEHTDAMMGGKIVCHRIRDGKVFYEGSTGGVVSLDHHSQLNLICAGEKYGRVKVCRGGNLEQIFSFRADAESCTHIACNPVFSLLLTYGKEGMLRMWNLKSGELIFEKPFTRKLAGLRFSDDGRFLVAVTSDGNILVYALLNFVDKVFSAQELLSQKKSLKDELEAIALEGKLAQPETISNILSSHEEGKWYIAARSSEAYLHKNLYDSLAWVVLGDSLFNLRCFDKARVAYNVAIDLQHPDPSCFLNKALTDYQVGCLDDALGSVKAFLRLRPNDEKGIHLLEYINKELKLISSWMSKI